MLLIPSILLAASVLTADGPQPSGKAVARTCALPEGWSEVASRKPRYVIFGELHGTQESPAFLGDLACALASRKQRVLVAIEQDAGTNDALQAAWNLPARQFDHALTSVGWKGREDGIASRAMFSMLVRLHELKEAGLPIGVVAFNGTAEDAKQKQFSGLAGQGPHEAAQAEHIREAAARASYDQVLVLVGGFHAEKARYGEGAKSFDPMAVRLAAYGSVVSLDMRYAKGTAWNCLFKPGVKILSGDVHDDDVECGDHPARSEVDLKRAPFIGLGAFPGAEPDPRYDGFFWLGPISGSAPQVPKSSESR